MKIELLHHKLAYAVLIIALAFLMVLFLGTWPNRMYQRIVVITLALFYFVWGTVTHVKAQKISRKVILEYAAISTLAGFLLFLITL